MLLFKKVWPSQKIKFNIIKSGIFMKSYDILSYKAKKCISSINLSGRSKDFLHCVFFVLLVTSIANMKCIFIVKENNIKLWHFTWPITAFSLELNLNSIADALRAESGQIAV